MQVPSSDNMFHIKGCVMAYVYSFFSMLGLVGVYFLNRKLTSSIYPVTVFYGICVSFSYMIFHMIVLHTHNIPILGIPVPDDDVFMQYAPLIYSVLCAFVSMYTHGRDSE